MMMMFTTEIIYSDSVLPVACNECLKLLSRGSDNSLLSTAVYCETIFLKNSNSVGCGVRDNEHNFTMSTYQELKICYRLWEVFTNGISDVRLKQHEKLLNIKLSNKSHNRRQKLA